MQLGGIGHSHGTDTHQVTQCLHQDHSVTEKESGAGAKLSAAKANLQAQNAQQEIFSLTAWVQRLLGKGGRTLRGIWGSGGADGGAGREGDGTGIAGAEALGQGSAAGDLQKDSFSRRRTAISEEAAHLAAAQANPYFSVAPENGTAHVPPFQRIKARVKEVAGHLSGHLPGKFFKPQAKSTFQMKQERQEKPKEDLRRHSKYRKDEVEIDCVLTDESYLLDSYDRTGGYSKLSVNSGKAAVTKKQQELETEKSG